MIADIALSNFSVRLNITETAVTSVSSVLVPKIAVVTQSHCQQLKQFLLYLFRIETEPRFTPDVIIQPRHASYLKLV